MKLTAVFLLILVFILEIYSPWLTSKSLSAGDWPFLFRETIREFSFIPAFRTGNYFALDFFFQSTAKILSSLSFSWALIERLVWFWPFLILSIFSSWFLSKTLFPKEKIIQFFAPFIYLLNTYILMVVGGGQMGIALAYAFAPLVFGLFINQLMTRLPARQGSRVNELRRLVLAGVVLAIQVMFDPRISFLTMGAVVVYLIFSVKNKLSVLFSLLTSVVFAILLHFYWLLPTFLVKQTALLSGYEKVAGVDFLSFANLSNTISLLHPNWPENIFGKTYFMRPEFLLLPILAFSSLLFINQLTSSRVKELKNSLISNSLINNKTILYFNFLGLIGAFLAKGAKPPFGGVYLWLFDHFPGMNLFRDPTKFYLLIVLSYSFLIPFSLEQISQRLKKISRVKYLVFGIFILYWLFLIRPAWLGQLGGTFQAKEVPAEYVVLKDFIHHQEEFFRTLWIPKKQRFGFWSNNHPEVDAEKFFVEDNCQEPFCSLKKEMPEKWGKGCFPSDRCYVRELAYFLNPKTAQVLSQLGVKYVIVPFDSEGEVFLAERRYNPQQRKEVEEFLDSVSWLKKLSVVDKIAVYEISEPKDRFFVAQEKGPNITWEMINPDRYKVQVRNVTWPFRLAFSEPYNRLWQARIRKKTIFSEPYAEVLNSFKLDKTGNFEVVIEFAAQKYIYIGGVTSLVVFLLTMSALIFL